MCWLGWVQRSAPVYQHHNSGFLSDTWFFRTQWNLKILPGRRVKLALPATHAPYNLVWGLQRSCADINGGRKRQRHLHPAHDRWSPLTMYNLIINWLKAKFLAWWLGALRFSGFVLLSKSVHRSFFFFLPTSLQWHCGLFIQKKNCNLSRNLLLPFHSQQKSHEETVNWFYDISVACSRFVIMKHLSNLTQMCLINSVTIGLSVCETQHPAKVPFTLLLIQTNPLYF